MDLAGCDEYRICAEMGALRVALLGMFKQRSVTGSDAPCRAVLFIIHLSTHAFPIWLHAIICPDSLVLKVMSHI